MAEKDQIVKEKFVFNGVMDFPGLYAHMHAWLRGEDYGVNEDKYNEKVGSSGRDLSSEWKATKKVSDYFKYEIRIMMIITTLSEVEATVDGQKKKMFKGRIETEIIGSLVKDYDSKWETSPFSRFFRDIYNKYIVPARVTHLEDELITDIQKFKDDAKTYLEMTGKRYGK